MSEEEARNLVTRALAAFNANDHEALLACLSEDVACDVPQMRREIGRDKFRWRLAALARHFRVQAADIAVMTAPGGVRAAAEFTLRGTYQATIKGWPAANGQSVQLPAGVFLDIDDEGRISRLTLCFDPGALRRALENG
ncbi:nuclear transport factor 2 family protein [Chelativorans sp. SCAU2101]|uniref:Nuclear transport factor 2 family protein n=1 Tax=Chelativorans petroleitrophicus TaxID=2975484 RepID=A0A9X2X9Z8_9HYPH|nr:nuclear transport factor 2 family protein [Chelativorans petroleitrophicus]MCT8991254.1 nuclear transport factor 2 family protein [Chelativorans petroleitrophicus]